MSFYDTAVTHIRASRLTDAEFLYTPSQVALACLHLSDRALAQRWLDYKYPNPQSGTFESEELRKQSEDAHAVIAAAIEVICDMIKNHGHAPEVEVVRNVDRRLRLCKNPEKVPGSKAFLAKQAEDEKKAEQKRNRKAQEETEKMEGDDPFGQPAVGGGLALVDYDDDDDDDDD